MRDMPYRLWHKYIASRESEKYNKEILSHKDTLAREHLLKVMQLAIRTVPFYKNMQDRGTLLRDFPVVNKQIIREHFFDLVRRDPENQRNRYENSSGGSTGMPQTFVQDQTFSAWSRATKKYYFQAFLGIDEDATSKVVLWGSERDLLHRRSLVSRSVDWMTHTTFYNTFRMSEKDFASCVDLLNKKHPKFLKGYASSLYALSRYIQEKNLSPFRPEIIYSSAETLHPFMRKCIEETFQQKVYNYYGSREVGPIAGECKEGKMHIFNFHTAVEVIKENNEPAEPEERGRILVTTLHNYAMPLIRYDIGDTAIQGSTCSCGLSLPVLERIVGRTSDNFITSDGAIVHGEYFTHLFYFRDWVKSFQVLQEKVDHVTIFIILKDETSIPVRDRKDIEEKIYLVMGQTTKILWNVVSDIPTTPQGKHLFTRSLIYGK